MGLKNTTPNYFLPNKKAISKKIFFVILFSFLLFFKSNAVTNTASTSGAWETGGNWSLGHAPLVTEDVVVPNTFAMTVNANDVCLSLTIAVGGTVTTTGAFTLSIAGNFANDGTFTAAVGSTIVFNAAVNSTVTGAGTFTVKNVTLNMGSKTTVLDVQSANFITGINTGNVYNFTFTQGTWKYNNASTLTDCHNNGAATALTIPFNVVIEADAGTMNLCKAGTNNNVILSGKLFINGGAVTVQIGQAVGAALDFRYQVNGGTPQLYVASGSLDCGAGFNAKATTDYIDFNMSGGLIHVADNGPTAGNTFLLQNVVGGSTVMTGGLIAVEDACTGASPDVDMGGGNIAPFTVTGGTLQLGFAGSLAGATFFGIQYYTATNYPNIVFNAGVAKNVGAWNSDGQTFNCLSLFVNSSMTFDLTSATPDPNVVFLSSNGTFALSVDGTFTIGTGGVTFKGNVDQLITASIAALTFNDMTVNMTAGFTTSTGGSLTTINVKNYTQTQGNYTPPANFNVSANWTHDAGTFTPGVNTVTFNGGAAQQILGALSSETFYNVVINKSNTLNTGGSMGTITTNNLTETAGNMNFTTLLAPSTLNINGSYLLTAGTFTAPPITNLLGNWTKNGGTFTPGTGRVLLTGTANSQTIGGTGSTTFYDLTTNNTFATVPQIVLGINTSVTDNITMTSGIVNLATFTLTLGTSAAATGTLTYTAGWLYGTGIFKRWIGTAILPIGNVSGLFPMGSSTDYHPLWFGNTAVASAGGAFTVSHTPATPGAVSITPYTDATWTPPAGGTSVVGISNAIWTIDRGAYNIAGITGQLRYGGTGFNVFLSADINASNVAGAVGTYGAPTNVTATYFEVNRTALANGHITNKAWYIGTSDLLNSPLP
ncbi:MAG: beta strand repeat-containing protein, partial [Bacteroidia bacterium]